MKNSHAKTVYTMLALMVLLLTVFVSTFSVPASAQDQISGAIWTTNAAGSQVNGNLFSNPRDVYLMGGPQKPGGPGLANGWYRFQVTDTSGKTLLSSDDVSNRQFQVKDGAIVKVNNHNFKNVTGKGLIIQLWPFEYTPKTVGEYKVWVTTEDSFQQYGFDASLSKTDNFKTGRSSNELLKVFELSVTTGISDLATTLDWDFSVSYRVETLEGLGPWTSGPLLWNRGEENGLEVYRYETTFANGATIYWKFSWTGDVNWESIGKGPETITENGMVNSEICPLFVVSGHKYEGTPGNSVASSNSEIILFNVSSDEYLDNYYADVGTGYYWFVAEASEIGTDFNVSTLGSTAGSELWHDFTANLPPADRTFDFYDYDIANLQGLNSPKDVELYPNFAVVFSPSNDGTGLYKLSSTNPGAFQFDVEIFRETIGKGVGGAPLVEMNILLPEAKEVWDTPNFFVKHSTPNNGVDPIWDIHIYAKNGDTITADITNDFTRKVDPVKGIDGKNVTVNGVIPLGATSVVVSLHLDYQISGSLTQDQVEALQGFTYEFTTIMGDPFGVRSLFGVR